MPDSFVEVTGKPTRSGTYYVLTQIAILDQNGQMLNVCCSKQWTFTVKGAAAKPASTTTTAASTKPKAKKADLVIGFLDPTLSFENGVFVKHVRVTQRVLIKNRGPDKSPGGTVVFHYPDEAIGPATPTGGAVSGCEVTRVAETKIAGALVFYRAECTLDPLGSGRSREFSVTYDVKWGNVKATATAHVNGTHDPSPDTTAESLEIDTANPFRSSHILKVDTDYKVEGSKTSNNPALK